MRLKPAALLLGAALGLSGAGAWWWSGGVALPGWPAGLTAGLQLLAGQSGSRAAPLEASDLPASSQPDSPSSEAQPTPEGIASERAADSEMPPQEPGCLGPAPAAAKAPAPPYPMSGRLGLWVAEVDPRTLEVIRAVGTNPDSVFPLASTYKQAVLWAVLREIDAGRLSPDERFEITPAAQSLGDYPFDNSTARTLTERMIRDSDNTATDLLQRRVGLEKVQRVADDLHLCQTRLILPTKDWWVMEAGLSQTYRDHPDWWQADNRLELAAQLDAEAQRHSAAELAPKLDHYFEQRHQPSDDLGTHNLSTPYEFATLLAHAYLRSGLSERGTRWQHEVAQLGYGKSALRAGQVGNLQTFYGKGGNGWRLLTYTGYFVTKDGHHVVYAFMQHGADQLYTMPNTHRAFAWINAAVDEVIGPQRRKPAASAATTSQAAASP
ncbi:serine hydrolase [Deinococcus sp. Marseille-Q6407]|uniref:serine hydrolase n=1 Tax=Deinococcus sp. Marseille-Q6407 TaxID=2969223 RepID=UPI0021BFDC02|nr:serine hydrolase [Deinococcus sp. Marseille-Q6407]